MGAWIEGVIIFLFAISQVSSHPLWVRGLKAKAIEAEQPEIKSHPLWVRGLKVKDGVPAGREYTVAPFMGAWIEGVKVVNI